jgi:cob(I)alamin adenosyltransferase
MAESFKGFIQVYTGDGKGKTTAALGLAMRAAGRGLMVYFGQFLKGRWTGEIAAAERLSPFLNLVQLGRKAFVDPAASPGEEDTNLAREGLEACREAMLSGTYSIIILDEVCVAVRLGLLSEIDLLNFLDQKPEGVEIVLTGRGATPGLEARADLVTEMKDVKHYGAGGVKARDGIER